MAQTMIQEVSHKSSMLWNYVNSDQAKHRRFSSNTDTITHACKYTWTNIHVRAHTHTHGYNIPIQKVSEWVSEWMDRKREREREKRERETLCVCVYGGGGGRGWMHMHLQKYPYPLYRKCAWAVCIMYPCVYVCVCTCLCRCVHACVHDSMCA